MHAMGLRCRTLVVAVATSVALSACQTVVPPARVVLMEVAPPRPSSVFLVDAREREKLGYREDASFKFFGDEVFQPTLFEVVRHGIASRFETSGGPVHVLLVKADVGYHVSSRQAMPSGSPYIPYGIPVGPAIVGALIGAGVVMAINRAAADESAIAYFTVRVNGQDVSGSSMVAITKDFGTAEALKRAADRAVSQLADLLRVAAEPEVAPE